MFLSIRYIIMLVWCDCVMKRVFISVCVRILVCVFLFMLVSSFWLLVGVVCVWRMKVCMRFWLVCGVGEGVLIVFELGY